MVAYLTEHARYLNVIGIGVIIAIAVLFSHNRRAINIRLAVSALLLHLIIAYCMIVNKWGKVIVGFIANAVSELSHFADVGMNFVFGQLANAEQPWGFIFAVKVVPLIIFIGAITSLLFHWGIIQVAVNGLNAILRPLIGAGGIETLSAIANSILGQAEAALFMSHYLPVMTRSELFVLMTSGMASISITVLIIYTVLGIPAAHLLAASVMSIPASLLIAKILLPEDELVAAADRMPIEYESRTDNMFDAISKGTFEGLKMGVSIIAMLISFLALLALGDYILSLAGQLINFLLGAGKVPFSLPSLSIAYVLSYIFAPFSYLMGLQGEALWQAGRLLGIKVALNELVAFNELMKVHLSPRDFIIVLYALCGFSNLSCIGIQIGMINSVAPKQKHLVTQLGLYAVLGSSLANLLSAMVVGLLI